MKILDKYILKSLFLKFFIITIFIIFFEIFQHLTKSNLLKIYTFLDILSIYPILSPFIVFQFLPFIFFLTIISTIQQMKNNYEFLTLKILGISNKIIIKSFFKFTIFVILFSYILGYIYPKTNIIFDIKKNNLDINSFLKKLSPNKINKINNYNIYFSYIDERHVIHNATIFLEKKKQKYNKKEIDDYLNKYTIYSEQLSLISLNENDIIANCKDVYLINNKNNEKNNILNKQSLPIDNIVIHAEEMDFLLKQIFKKNKSNNNKTNMFQKMGIKQLIWNKYKNINIYNEKLIEIHSRLIFNCIIIITILATCCISIFSNHFRFSKIKTNIVIIIGVYLSISREFFLKTMVINHIILLYYLHLLLICILSLIVVLKKNK